jgi:hypothetical protein
MECVEALFFSLLESNNHPSSKFNVIKALNELALFAEIKDQI